MNQSASTQQDILVVDDDIAIVQVLGRVLSSMGRVRFATSGEAALRLATEITPDLILLDVQLPDMSGAEVWKTLSRLEAFRDVPMIFITSQSDERSEEAGLAIGAMDFIAKPLRPAVVAARCSTQLRLKAALDSLRHQARTDGLTGLMNRRDFDDRLEREWALACRSRRPISLLMIDVDHFKRFNDTYGHPEGDKVLSGVARAIGSQTRRPSDAAARYGGEEFVVLLPETDGSGAGAVAQAIATAITGLALPHLHGVDGMVSVSIGGATFCDTSAATPSDSIGMGDARPPAELLQRADEALYASKAAGRARVTLRALD